MVRGFITSAWRVVLASRTAGRAAAQGTAAVRPQNRNGQKGEEWGKFRFFPVQQRQNGSDWVGHWAKRGLPR